MRRVTATLEDSLSKKLRIEAAENEMSMSQFISKVLKDHFKDKTQLQRRTERS